MGGSVSQEQARKLERRLFKEQKPWHTPAQSNALRKALHTEFDRLMKRGASKNEAFQVVRRKYVAKGRKVALQTAESGGSAAVGPNAKGVLTALGNAGAGSNPSHSAAVGSSSTLAKGKGGPPSASKAAGAGPKQLAVFGVKKDGLSFATARQSLEAQISAYEWLGASNGGKSRGTGASAGSGNIATTSAFKFKRLVAGAASKQRAGLNPAEPKGLAKENAAGGARVAKSELGEADPSSTPADCRMLSMGIVPASSASTPGAAAKRLPPAVANSPATGNRQSSPSLDAVLNLANVTVDHRAGSAAGREQCADVDADVDEPPSTELARTGSSRSTSSQRSAASASSVQSRRPPSSMQSTTTTHTLSRASSSNSSGGRGSGTHSNNSTNGSKGKELLDSALNVPSLNLQNLNDHVVSITRGRARLFWAAIRAAVRQTRRWLIHQDAISSDLSRIGAANALSPASESSGEFPARGVRGFKAASVGASSSSESAAADASDKSNLGQQIIREGELNSLENTIGHFESTSAYFSRRLRLNLYKSVGAGAAGGPRLLTSSNDSSVGNNTSTRYTLLQKIGQGAFGSVHRAWDKMEGCDVAVKIVKTTIVGDGGSMSFGGDDDEYATAESSGRRKASGSTQKHVNKPFAMLQNEISILKECKSPFVTRYYRSHEKISSFWIVMEFFDFGSVHDILKVLPGHAFPEIAISAICAAVLRGLVYLHHKKIIHRDLKCGNVLLDREGRCKLADFGVSTAVRESTLKQSGSAAGNSSVGAAGNNGQHRESSGHMFAGTAYYTAPEILASGRHCTAVADIWSMGVMAVEMAEGQNPYAKYKNILAAIHGIPKDPPPELSDGPNPDVIDLDLPAAGAGATSPPLKPSTATSDKPGTANSSRADRKWSDAFRAFIRDMLVKDPTKRPPAMQAIHEEFVSGDIRLFSENHGRHPALRELARRYADVASRVRDEFLNSTGGRFGYDTEALGSQFDTFDLFSTQGGLSTGLNTARTRESDLYASATFENRPDGNGTRPTTARTFDSDIPDELDDELDDDLLMVSSDAGFDTDAVQSSSGDDYADDVFEDAEPVDTDGNSFPPGPVLEESVPVPLARPQRRRDDTDDRGGSGSRSSAKPPLATRRGRSSAEPTDIDSPSQVGLVMRRANLSSRERMRLEAASSGTGGPHTGASGSAPTGVAPLSARGEKPKSRKRSKGSQGSKRGKTKDRSVPTPAFVQAGGPGLAQVSAHESGALHGVEFGDKLDTFTLPLSAPATQGKVFYEIQLEQLGKSSVPQFGWVTPGFHADGSEKGDNDGLAAGGGTGRHSRTSSSSSMSGSKASRGKSKKKHTSGVGADCNSWAIDVRKSKKFHNGVVEDLGGPKWQTGDTVGCAADLTEGTIMFGHNGKWVTAFTDIRTADGLVPAVSGKNNLNVKVNFGQNEFRYGPPDDSFERIDRALHSMMKRKNEAGASATGARVDTSDEPKKGAASATTSLSNASPPSRAGTRHKGFKGDGFRRRIGTEKDASEAKQSQAKEQLQASAPHSRMLSPSKSRRQSSVGGLNLSLEKALKADDGPSTFDVEAHLDARLEQWNNQDRNQQREQQKKKKKGGNRSATTAASPGHEKVTGINRFGRKKTKTSAHDRKDSSSSSAAGKSLSSTANSASTRASAATGSGVPSPSSSRVHSRNPSGASISSTDRRGSRGNGRRSPSSSLSLGPSLEEGDASSDLDSSFTAAAAALAALAATKMRHGAMPSRRPSASRLRLEVAAASPLTQATLALAAQASARGTSTASSAYSRDSSRSRSRSRSGNDPDDLLIPSRVTGVVGASGEASSKYVRRSSTEIASSTSVGSSSSRRASSGRHRADVETGVRVGNGNMPLTKMLSTGAVGLGSGRSDFASAVGTGSSSHAAHDGKGDTILGRRPNAESGGPSRRNSRRISTTSNGFVDGDSDADSEAGAGSVREQLSLPSIHRAR